MPTGDWWGDHAIRPGNARIPAREFDLHVIVVGSKHLNVAPRTGRALDYCRVPIGLRPMQFGLGSERNPSPLAGRYTREPLKCLVDAGSEDSHFRAEIAKDLALRPNNGRIVFIPSSGVAEDRARQEV